uniref:(northern house mosquito) hypothetical protein n=1 Tax=Culex pipiens TaxID=7175 RepID=A0A8D8GKJ5_CULPI
MASSHLSRRSGSRGKRCLDTSPSAHRFRLWKSIPHDGTKHFMFVFTWHKTKTTGFVFCLLLVFEFRTVTMTFPKSGSSKNQLTINFLFLSLFLLQLLSFCFIRLCIRFGRVAVKCIFRPIKFNVSNKKK